MKVIPSDEKVGWLNVQWQDSVEEATSEEIHSNNVILGALIRADIPILSFESQGGRLQDVFLHLTEEVSE